MKDNVTFQLTALIMAQGLSGAVQAQSTNTPPVSTGSTNSPAQLPKVVVTDQQEKEPYKPETVSSPKYTEPLRDIPQTITVVPRAVMEEQGATSLRDVLRNVPGISIQAGEGGVPAGDNMSVRGFNARTDLFVDGIRDIGGYTRDPFNLEQVEVVKGPSSAFAGRGSTGGSVNLQSKEPRRNPIYGGTLGFGTDDYKRFTLDVNQPVDKLGLPSTSLRLNGVWHESGVAGRDVVENERWGIAPSLAFGLDTPTRVVLSYLHLDQDNIPDYGIPWVPEANTALAGYAGKPAPVDFSNFYGLKDRDYEKTVTDVVTGKIEHDFNESVSLRNLLRYGQNKRDSLITAPRFASNTSTDINRNLQSRDQKDTILANQTDLTLKFDTGIVENTLVPGVEFAQEFSENFARSGPNAPVANLYRPNPNDPYLGSVRRTGARTEADATSAAVYAFDTAKLNEQFELNGGVRWDHFNVDYKSVATNGVSTKLDRTDEMLSWRAGIVYKPLQNGSIYAAYGTSFNPSAEGLTLANTANAANNVDTEPEESRTIEVGTKWDFFQNRLSLTFALFRTDKTNTRTEDPTDPADIVVLEGEQRVDGVELGLAGSITPEWRVFGGYTYMASEIRESRNAAELGNELTNTPEHTFNFWTTYQLPFDLEVGAGAQFVDSRYANTTNTRQAPSYWLFDAMAAYHVNQNVTLRLNIYNLADEEFIDRVGGGHFVPGAGRSAMLTASFSY